MRILRRLSEAIGVSGAEGEIRNIIREMVEPHVDSIQTDTMGNLLAFKKGSGEVDLTVLLDAHMDEVGLMVTGYTNGGMLKVKAVGGLDDRILPGTRVRVGPGCIPGVIGAKPIHLLSGEEYAKVVKLDAMQVDIGAASKDAARGKAPLGTRIAFDSEFVTLGPTVRGKAFDDRAGCAVLVHLLQGEPFPFDMWGAFAVQEEVGMRGAAIAAHRTHPDLAFVLEGTIADDLPKDRDVSPTTELGKGPALSAMDHSTIYDPRLNRLLEDTAESLGLAVQYKQPGIGGTDAGAINTARTGVPVAAVSVPCRYIHSPRAILDKQDYRNTIKLMQGALAQLTPGVLGR